jgi:hypothetical protein
MDRLCQRRRRGTGSAWDPETRSPQIAPISVRSAPTAPSVLYLCLSRVLGLVRSEERATADAELEIAVLRHQIAVLRRQVKRPVYRSSDRAFLAAASRLLPREVWRSFLVRPETLIRWHCRLQRASGRVRTGRMVGRPSTRTPGASSCAWPGRTSGGATSGSRASSSVWGIRVSATTLATILGAHGLGPAPRRGGLPVPWVAPMSSRDSQAMTHDGPDSQRDSYAARHGGSPSPAGKRDRRAACGASVLLAYLRLEAEDLSGFLTGGQKTCPRRGTRIS